MYVISLPFLDTSGSLNLHKPLFGKDLTRGSHLIMTLPLYALRCSGAADYDNVTAVERFLTAMWSASDYRLVSVEATQIHKVAGGRCIWIVKFRRLDNETVDENTFRSFSLLAIRYIPIYGNFFTAGFGVSAMDTYLYIIYEVISCTCQPVFQHNRDVNIPWPRQSSIFLTFDLLRELDIENHRPFNLIVGYQNEDSYYEIVQIKAVHVGPEDTIETVEGKLGLSSAENISDALKNLHI